MKVIALMVKDGPTLRINQRVRPFLRPTLEDQSQLPMDLMPSRLLLQLLGALPSLQLESKPHTQELLHPKKQMPQPE